MMDENSETLLDLLHDESQKAVVDQFETLLEDVVAVFVLNAYAHARSQF
jgi:hypothetical protein